MPRAIMETNTLTEKALAVIQAYMHLPIGSNVPCPYHNNRRHKVRAGLRALVGKGSVNDIVDEATIVSIREKKPLAALTSPELAKFLVDHHIGIDCAGFAYYVLGEESRALNRGTFRKRLRYPFATSPLRKLIILLRKVENAGVSTFAHPDNSREVALAEVKPGDFIAMTYAGVGTTLDHMVIIHAVDKENGQVKTIHYSNATQWPSDGLYNHGVRQGTIEILDPTKSIINQYWVENGKAGNENYTLVRALQSSSCTIRRLNWF